MTTPRERLYPMHYLVAVGGLGAALFGIVLLNGFSYLGETALVLGIGLGSLVVGLLLTGWVAKKRLPTAVVLGVCALVVVGALGVFAMRYAAAVAANELWRREMAVTDICGGGPAVPSDAAPPSAFRVRYLYARDDGHLWMDASASSEWPVEHVPELVVCIVESNDVVEQQVYIDEEDGTPLTIARERPVVTLRAIRTADAQVVLETRLTGGEPGPFPYEIGTGIESHLRGDPVTRAAIDAAIAPALTAR